MNLTQLGGEPNDRSIRLLRLLGVLAAVIVPPFRYILPAEATDPLWIRFALSGIALSIVSASYIWPQLQRKGRELSYVLGFVITGWMLWLAIINHLDQAYTSSYYIMLFATIILFRDKSWLIAFVSFNGLAALISVLLTPNPTFSPITFAAMVISILCLGSFGQWMGVLEFQESLKVGNRLQFLNETALANSNEGIIVTDAQGYLQRNNSLFEQLFEIVIQEEEILPADKWLQAVQRRLQAPEIVMAWSKCITSDTRSEFKQQFQLVDGRYLRLYSKPIIDGDQNHGRIWFFKDFTADHQRNTLMEQQQLRLRRQNEMLLSLSTDPVMQIGELATAAGLVAQEAAQTLNAERATVWRMGPQDEALDCLQTYHTKTGLTDQEGRLVPTGGSASLGKILSERVLSLSGEDWGGIVREGKENQAHQGGRLLLVPLRLHGRVIGAISAERSMEQADWSLDDLQFLAAVGDLLATAVLVGERRTAERDLAKSAALLQAVFELAGVGILVTRLDRSVIDCNDTYLTIFGLERQFVMEASPDAVIAKSQELVADLEHVNLRLKFLHENPDENRYEPLFFKDGRILETFTEVLRVDGQIIGRVWFYRDVTERMQADGRLRASETRNKAIIDAIPDLMLRISQSCGILDLKMPDGWEQSGLIRNAEAQTVKELLPLELAQEIMTQAGQVFVTQELAWHEQAIQLEGVLRDIETRIAPSGANEVLIMLRDVTDRKKTEKELLQRNHELDSFVYRASHDLKAPLNSLMGLIDIIRSESQDPALTTYLHLMDRSVVKLDTFIRNLTDFSRINRAAIVYQSVDFAQLIAEINDSLHYMQNTDRLVKNIHIEQDSPFYGDSLHLGIVISNLISNAIKYFDPKKPQSHVDIHVRCSHERCVIEIADNGVGIPEIHQARIFELFYRATNQSFGSGLGLYITRNAIEKIGGTIELTSQEGVGTRFTVSVPNHVEVAKELA